MSRIRFVALAGSAVAAVALLFASGSEAASRGGSRGGYSGGGNRGGYYGGGNRGGYYGNRGGYYGGYFWGGIGVYPGAFYDYSYGVAPSYVVPVAPYYGSMPAAPSADASDRTVHISVRSPADAEIWFEGSKTTQTGAVREFESPELKPGRAYTYEVRARWTQDGKKVSRTQTIDVSAGDRKTVDFTKSAN